MLELFPEPVRDRWSRTAAQYSNWVDQKIEQRLRKDLYMPWREIPYPADGNYCQITSLQGWTRSRKIFQKNEIVFDQEYFNRIPRRLWFWTSNGVKFFWDNIGNNGAQICAVHPNDKEDRTVVWRGGQCDRPDLFNWYKQELEPIKVMLKTVAVVFIGIPAEYTSAGRRGFVQVITWPPRPKALTSRPTS